MQEEVRYGVESRVEISKVLETHFSSILQHDLPEGEFEGAQAPGIVQLQL